MSLHDVAFGCVNESAVSSFYRISHCTYQKYILSTLKRVYEIADRFINRPVEPITGSNMQSLYEEFLNIDIPYESGKYDGFIRTQLRQKRDDIFGYFMDRSAESTNNIA